MLDYYQPPKVEYVSYVEDVRENVRDAYGSVAKSNKDGKCCGNARSCCGVGTHLDEEYARELGYTQEEIDQAPKGSNMGLGCGNPQAIAALKEGEIVLDLGSGGGFDVFLAARKVGPKGKVFGVDMTPEMLLQARSYAEKNGYKNVEFLLGEIEHLPLANQSVDVVISNCVVNLAADKAQVFKETFRVLKGGGRIAISDIVANKPLPAEMKNNKELYCNCISGALSINELKKILAQAGFVDIVIETQENSRMFIKDWVPNAKAEDYVVSAKIKALKPKLKK